MTSTLTTEQLADWLARLRSVQPISPDNALGHSRSLQPVHVVYGGAHLFRADTAQKLGRLALRSLDEYASDVDQFAAALGLATDVIDLDAVYAAVIEKLSTEPVEDLRIDFEDGYGLRADAEEDGHARAAATATAEGMRAGSLPAFLGLRIKSLSPENAARAIRTLEIYLTSLIQATGGELPGGFAVTLPKVEHEKQVAILAEICGELEVGLGLADGSLKLELMVESPRALFDANGNAALPRMLAAGRGKVRGAHFGAFDFTAACNISASLQDLRHPLCDFARALMQTSLAGTGVWLSDSVTAVMPVPVHRGAGLSAAQEVENHSVVHQAWKMHYDNIRHSLANGFYQSWDLHPAQLPVRYFAQQIFFRENLAASAARLRNFVERATQASVMGSHFDDTATAQGLLNFFAQALASKVLTEAEGTALTGLTAAELHGRSFSLIMERNNPQGVIGDKPPPGKPVAGML